MRNELSDRAQALLEAAKQQGGPTAAQKAKLAVALMAVTGEAAAGAAAVAGATAATGGSALASGAAASVSVVKLVGAGLAAMLVGASGTLAVTKGLGWRTPLDAPVAAPAIAAPAVAAPAVAAPAVAAPAVGERSVQTEVPLLPVVTEPVPAPTKPPDVPVSEDGPSTATPRSVPRTPRPAPHLAPAVADPPAPLVVPTPDVPRPASLSTSVRPDTTTAQVTALGAALEALDEGHASEALSIASDARRTFPSGVLRPELTVVEIEALCALDQEGEARALAESMPAADRTPLVLERLRRSCAK
jgi:hypothetical protein